MRKVEKWKSEKVTKIAVQTFEDLFVWKKARELANAIYAVCDQSPVSRDFGLRDQLQRASVSVMSNIAEGFERGTTPDFLHFLYIAKGSAGELRSQLYLVRDRGLVSEETFVSCSEAARQTGSLLSKLISSLKEKLVKEAEEKKRRKKTKTEKIAADMPSSNSFKSPSIPELKPFPFYPDPFDL